MGGNDGEMNGRIAMGTAPAGSGEMTGPGAGAGVAGVFAQASATRVDTASTARKAWSDDIPGSLPRAMLWRER